MKVLVTGHSGYIGRHVMASFRGTPGVTVVGFDRVESDKMVETQSSVMSNFNPDIVVHCGAIRDSQWTHPEIFFWNTQMTHYMAKECVARGAHLIFLSTGLAYDPLSHYAWSKSLAEQLLEIYDDFDPCILRITNVWGNEEAVPPTQRSVPTQILERQLEYVFDIHRDYVHVEDVVNAIHLAVSESGLYDVGTGTAYSPIQLAQDVGYDVQVGRPEVVLGMELPKVVLAKHLLPGFVPVPFEERWKEEKDARNIRNTA